MKPCAKSLLESIIDYAGLFPPARLSMEDAFARFLDHRSSNDGWMLARFVCPVSRLDELEELIDTAGPVELPITISALGRGGRTLEDFIDAVDSDSIGIAAFNARQADRALIDAFEVRLPESGGAAIAVKKAWTRLNRSGPDPLRPFFEVSLLGDWRPRLPAAAAAVRDANRKANKDQPIGLKIRCGGLEASAVPEVVAVAAAIATCRATGISLKATQGLHHPFRHHDSEMDVEVHGFLNLFAASALAYVHDLPVTTLIDIVGETDPEAFDFGTDRLTWRDFEASADQVAEARRSILTSFGSCSFSEPRNDVRGLGIVGEGAHQV